MRKTVHDARYLTLIGSLKAARKSRGIGQAQLALALGVSRQWIGHVENCQTRLDVLQLLSYCRALEIDAGEMIKLLEGAL